MAKPVFPKWAIDDQQDAISGQYNVVAPPLDKELLGWFLGEKPNRQWWNWLHRQAYLSLLWLDQQSTTVTTGASGVGLLPIDDAIFTIDAIDITTPNNFLKVTGIKRPGVAPSFATASKQNTVLDIGSTTASGNVAITGGSGNLLVRAISSKLTP